MSSTSPKARLAHALAIAASLLLPSCAVERLLTITSAPPGAEIRLDGEVVGTTPLTIPFEYYGSRRVTLYLQGHLSHSQVIEIKPPWFSRPGLDFVAEVLLPLGFKDLHEFHATLYPGVGRLQPSDFSAVLERAEELRRAGPEGPAPPSSQDRD